MTLIERLGAFVTAVANEFNAVRNEMPVLIPVDGQAAMDDILDDETWVTDAFYIVFEE